MLQAAIDHADVRRRRALLARIQRRFETVTETIHAGSRQVRFTRIADPNRVLSDVAEAEDYRERITGVRLDDDQLRLPYWAEIWDSARGIVQMLGHEKDGQLVGQRVLDLGCGMGLVGTLAAMLGAEVTFADLESDALLFARLNSLPWRRQIRARQLNWRTDRLGRRFDLIIGADILYEQSQWRALERFWREHLADGGQVLLGEPGRPTGDLFINWIQHHRWRLVIKQKRIETRSTPIRLLWLDEPR